MFPWPTCRHVSFQDFASFLTSHSSIQQFCAQEAGTWDWTITTFELQKIAAVWGGSHDNRSRPFADHGTLVLPGCSGPGPPVVILPSLLHGMGFVWYGSEVTVVYLDQSEGATQEHPFVRSWDVFLKWKIAAEMCPEVGDLSGIFWRNWNNKWPTKSPQNKPTALRRTIQLSPSRLWICSIDRGWGNLEFGSLCSESRVASCLAIFEVRHYDLIYPKWDAVCSWSLKLQSWESDEPWFLMSHPKPDSGFWKNHDVGWGKFKGFLQQVHVFEWDVQSTLWRWVQEVLFLIDALRLSNRACQTHSTVRWGDAEKEEVSNLDQFWGKVSRSQENQCWFCVCWPYTSCLDLPKPIEIMCARV